MTAIETRVGIDTQIRLTPENVHKELEKAHGRFYRLDIAQMLALQNLVPPDGNIFCEPHDHNKDRPPEHWSDAIYIAHYRIVDQEGVTHEVFVSAIGPGGKSSNHLHHAPIKERYTKAKKIEGVNLLLNNTELVPLRDKFVVEPETYHEVHVSKESGKPAILIIDMENVGSTPHGQLHDHRLDLE